MLPDLKQEDRRIANIHTSAFQAWTLEDGAEMGGEVLQLNDRPMGVGFHVFRMPPGARTDAHEHTSDEEFLVLEGELIDHDGTRYAIGDLVWLKKGSVHSSYTPNGCLLAVYIETPERAL